MKEEGKMKREEYNGSGRAKLYWLCVIRLLLSSFILHPSSFSQGFAQSVFRVIPSVEATLEGGDVNILVIRTDNENFQLRVPKEYGAQIRLSDQSIIFTSQNGSSVITMKMTTNYPGALPKMETLRDLVAQKFVTASLVQTSPCITSYRTGLLFDLFQPVAGNLTVRIRDAYLAFPEGSFEFTLSCDLREYDKNRLSFAWLLNSFRLQAQPAMKKL
jgi:hypothetical protein